MGIVGCGSSSSDSAGETPITPYTRVAVINDSTDVVGIADKIAHYVTLTDETNATGHAFPAPWVIAGANKKDGETYGLADLLAIPAAGAGPIGNKSRVIEFCNGKYATMATNTGRFHGSALPCEVAVHSDGTNTYVDMLDACYLFTLFY